ncbi:reverse transcriptase domain-containing protein [Tanacetum coccineum]
MKEVHYYSWLSNPVMVKKHDESWRMCVDFKDLNKACPQDGYPLSEIDWKVESLCGYPFKCFLYAYKGYHQIEMAEEDKEKTAFITSQGIFCYSKMSSDLKNVRATYQRLVDRAPEEVHKEERFPMDSGSRSSLQIDEETHRGSPNADRTKGKGGVNHVLRRGQGSYQAYHAVIMTERMAMQIPKCTYVAAPYRAGDQLHPHGKTGVSLAQRKQAAEKILPGTHNCCNHISADKATAVKLRNHRKDANEESPNELMAEPEELPEPWTLFTDGPSCIYGSGAGLIQTNTEGVEFTYAMRFRFEATNNEAKYEALISGLRITEQMGVKNLQANVDSRLVANQVNSSYIAKELGMVQYLEKVKTLTSNFKEFSIKQVPQSENKKANALSKIASTSFTHLSKQVLVEELNEKSINEKEDLAIVEEEGHTWMTPICEYLTKEILPKDKKKASAVRHKASRFRLPGEIVSDNGKQFRDNPFKDWCEKLCIRQCFVSMKHPQTNGLVERANRSLGEGIKARLDERSKDWIEELSHVLWAHRTMIKSSNGKTPFSLTYGTEAVIPAKIGIPTLWTAKSAAQASNWGTWSTAAMMQATPRTEVNLDLNGKDRMKSQNHWEREHTSSKTAKEMNFRERGTFVISKM